MKFVQVSDDLKDDVLTLEINKYNKKGEHTDDDKHTFAKALHETRHDRTSYTKFYAVTHDNALYDPRGTNSNREAYLDLKLKEVSKATFDYYMLYLTSRNSLYMTRAQRSFIDG